MKDDRGHRLCELGPCEDQAVVAFFFRGFWHYRCATHGEAAGSSLYHLGMFEQALAPEKSRS